MSNGQLHVEPRTRSLTGIQILGTGSYVPENVVSNHDLRDSHGFDPEWIVNRTRNSRTPVRAAPPGHQRPLHPGGDSLPEVCRLRAV